MAKYYLVEEKDNTGCFVAIAIAAVILIAIAWIAMYALLILLGIVLAVGALIGTVLALKDYVLALRDSISCYRYADKPERFPLPAFIYRWLRIVWGTIVISWKYIVADLKNYFGKAGFYRLLSFKKWLNIFAGISLAVCGVLLSLFIVFIHLYILWIALCVLAVALAVFATVFGLVGVFLSAAFATTNYISCARDSRNRMATVLSAYVTDCGYREYLAIIREYWSETVARIKTGLTSFSGSSLLSVKAWLRFAEGALLILTGTILFVPYALIHILVQSVLFVVFKIASLFAR